MPPESFRNCAEPSKPGSSFHGSFLFRSPASDNPKGVPLEEVLSGESGNRELAGGAGQGRLSF